MSISKYKLVLFIFVGHFGTHPRLGPAGISPGPLHRRKLRPGSPKRAKENRPGNLTGAASAALFIFLHAIRKHQKREEDQ